MSNHLYSSGGNIRPNLVGAALGHAKYGGKLSGVNSSIAKRFAEKFEKTAHKVPGIGSKYSAHDVDKIIDKIERDKGDNINDVNLEKIREILTSRDTNT